MDRVAGLESPVSLARRDEEVRRHRSRMLESYGLT
jgi:hypothetical protein